MAGWNDREDAWGGFANSVPDYTDAPNEMGGRGGAWDGVDFGDWREGAPSAEISDRQQPGDWWARWSPLLKWGHTYQIELCNQAGLDLAYHLGMAQNLAQRLTGLHRPGAYPSWTANSLYTTLHALDDHLNEAQRLTGQIAVLGCP